VLAHARRLAGKERREERGERREERGVRRGRGEKEKR
jgi:hypothetical protein